MREVENWNRTLITEKVLKIIKELPKKKPAPTLEDVKGMFLQTPRSKQLSYILSFQSMENNDVLSISF